MRKKDIVKELRGLFTEDKICLFYHGDFDDAFMEEIIFLSDNDVSRKSRRRMAFLMAESFQNVVRHGNANLLSTSSSLFGVRRLDPFIHVFSTNAVDSETRNTLEKKFSQLSGLDQTELKTLYRESLSVTKLSAKGGAGLGLIEMARKSKSPLQYSFGPLTSDTCSFNLQIDLLLDGTEESTRGLPLSIQENADLHQYIMKHKIIFLLKGDFTDDLTMPLLKVLEGNTEVSNSSTAYLAYHTAVEMIQNIVRHAKVKDGINDGLFCLMESESGYVLCAGNYVNKESKVDQFIESINHKSEEELNQIYRTGLRTSLNDDGNSAKVGLIDIRRKIDKPFEYEIIESELGRYFVLCAEIKRK